MVTQVSLHSRLNFYFVHELGVHTGARAGQRLQCGRRFELAIYQHSARGVRSFSSRLAAFDDQNARSFFAKFDRQRESDDACTDNDDVPSPHADIVEEGSTESPQRRGLNGRRLFRVA